MLPSDPDLPGADGLLGERGRATVDRFLCARGWSAGDIRPVQVLYRPAISARVRFLADAVHRCGARAALSTTVETRREAPPGLALGRPPAAVPLLPEPLAAVGPYTVWVFPFDPSLPGLPDAAAGSCLPERLRPAVEVRQVDPVGYRPRHRAVLRYKLTPDGAHGSSPGGSSDRTLSLFAKVLRPERARAVLDIAREVRHVELPIHLGLPFARRASGILFTRAVAGRPLRDLLLASGPLPAPERLARLGDRLGVLAADLPETARTRSPRGVPAPERAMAAGDLLARLVPARAGVAARVADAVAAWAARDPIPLQIVHGDLHEAQILLAPDGSLGLVDLDDLGYGDPILDAASLSAHLLALAGNAPAGAAADIRAYRAALRAAFVDHLGCDAASLAWREAYAMLLLASGPFRVVRPDWPDRVAARVDLAAALLADQD